MPLLDTDRELTRHSYYAATASRTQHFAALQGDGGACDVAIVGGGLAGLAAAIELRERGFDVALLEAHEIGWGASGRNGGQAIHGLACDMATVEAQLGQAAAKRGFDMSIESLDLMRAYCARFAIDCDWRDGHLAVATSERKARHLRDGVDAMQSRYGYPLQWIDRAELPRWIASRSYVAGAHGGEITTPDLLREHDRLLRDNNWRLGGGLSYGLPLVELVASYLEFVSGSDTHAGRAFTGGVSVPLGRSRP